jgi:peptidoglycan/LPS O-acetylase OafA/YrhL
MSADFTATNEPRSRVEVLDLLRILAVFSVLLFHYGFRGAAADGYTNVTLAGLVPFIKYGYLGVQLFFVISGFVIAYSAEGRTAVSFAIARTARIYPGFVFCMTLTFIVTLAIGAPRLEATLAQWFANLLIVSPALKQPFMDGAYWSIVTEITFYGWIFVLILARLFHGNTAVIVIAWLAISVIDQTFVHSAVLQRLFLTDQSGFFCAGLVLYEMFRGRRHLTWLLLALSTVTAVNQGLAGADWMRNHYHIEMDDLVIALACIASVGAVAVAMNMRRVPLPPEIVLAIGGLTYPLYLLHQHVGFMLINRFEHAAPPLLLIVSVATAITITSYVTWRFVEKPAQRQLKRLLSNTAIYFANRFAAVPDLPPALAQWGRSSEKKPTR